MSKNNRKKRHGTKRKRLTVLLVYELIALCFLSVVLIGAATFFHKFSLITRTSLDDDKVITAEEANNTDATSEVSSEKSEIIDETVELEGIDVIALVGVDTRSTSDSGSNSDTMIICVLDHNEEEIRLCSLYRDTILNVGNDFYGNPDYYSKANAAYNLGGPEQFLTMMNLNLDLNITEFVTVDFSALAKCVDILGGIDIEMTKEEVGHTNNYNVETSKEAGVEYEELEIPDDENFDGDVTLTFHCNGSQAVSYARIRYTEGNDFRRTSRQRYVLSLIKEKAKSANLITLNYLIDELLPAVTTNISNTKLMTIVKAVLSYDMGEDNMKGFPFVHIEDEFNDQDAVIPVTLEYNVTLLHEFLFPDEAYNPSYTMEGYSSYIEYFSGYGESDIEWISEIDDEGELDGINEEEYLNRTGEAIESVSDEQ